MRQRFSNKKDFIKNFNKKKICQQSQQEKRYGRFYIKPDNAYIADNKQMFADKLLTNSVVTSNCYTTLNMFEHVLA